MWRLDHRKTGRISPLSNQAKTHPDTVRHGKVTVELCIVRFEMRLHALCANLMCVYMHAMGALGVWEGGHPVRTAWKDPSKWKNRMAIVDDLGLERLPGGGKWVSRKSL